MDKNNSIKLTLSEVSEDVKYGYTASANSEIVGPRFLRITDIVPDHIDWDSVPYAVIPDGEYEKYRLAHGDIVIARTGATTGFSKWLRNPPEAVFASYLVRFRIKPEHNSRYVGQIVQSDFFKRYIQANIGGAAQPQANAKVLGSFPLHLPIRAIQDKISAILSAYDDLIEKNIRRIKILEELAQSIYKEWFVNYRFPGHENVRMVDSELGEVPEGWEVRRLKDICSKVSYGYTASSQQEPIGPKFLRITDIVPDSIDWESVPYCEIDKKNLEKHLLKEGDIVIARTGATTGYAKRINKRHPVSVYASYLVRLRVESGSSVFAGLAVESDAYKSFIKSNIGGAAQPNANAQVLTSYPICLPPRQILLQLEGVVQEFIDQRELLQEKNRHLRQTRDLLLPKLVSGELDVEELDIAVA